MLCIICVCIYPYVCVNNFISCCFLLNSFDSIDFLSQKETKTIWKLLNSLFLKPSRVKWNWLLYSYDHFIVRNQFDQSNKTFNVGQLSIDAKLFEGKFQKKNKIIIYFCRFVYTIFFWVCCWYFKSVHTSDFGCVAFFIIRKCMQFSFILFRTWNHRVNSTKIFINHNYLLSEAKFFSPGIRIVPMLKLVLHSKCSLVPAYILKMVDGGGIFVAQCCVGNFSLFPSLSQQRSSICSIESTKSLHDKILWYSEN